MFKGITFRNRSPLAGSGRHPHTLAMPYTHPEHGLALEPGRVICVSLKSRHLVTPQGPCRGRSPALGEEICLGLKVKFSYCRIPSIRTPNLVLL